MMKGLNTTAGEQTKIPQKFSNILQFDRLIHYFYRIAIKRRPYGTFYDTRVLCL